MNFFREYSQKEIEEMKYIPLEDFKFPPQTPESSSVPSVWLPTKQTNMEKFLQVCQDALDTKVSPDNPVPDEVSCAWDMSILIRRMPNFQDFKKQASTKELDFQLFMDKRFERLTEPKLGAIWMYVAKTNSKGGIITYGHVLAQITKDRLASNNSLGKDKGKFTGNYTLESAKQEFEIKRGLKRYLYGFKD